MSNRDFYIDAAAQRANEIDAQKAQALADLASARQYGDHSAAAQAVQQIADLDASRANLESLHSRYVQSQTPPQPRQLSDEERLNKPIDQMDYNDALALARTSRYGKDLTHEDLQAGYAEVARRRGRQEG